MSSLVHGPAAFELRWLGGLRRRADAVAGLRLTPSGDGWALLRADGHLVFEAFGTQGRRRCLEFACTHGSLVVFS